MKKLWWKKMTCETCGYRARTLAGARRNLSQGLGESIRHKKCYNPLVFPGGGRMVRDTILTETE